MRWAGLSKTALLILALSALLLAAPALAEPPTIDASAAVLIDAEAATPLFRKAMHEPRPMASTTKIMTALLALESCPLDDSVLVGPAAAKASGFSLYLKAGDIMQMDDLLAALLLASANDAAVAIAEHVSGSVSAFAARMNERARELGATHTHFVNPHGLHHPDHHSSAYDLALITREALKHPRFRELVDTRATKIAFPRAPSRTRWVKNHNKLLGRAEFVDGVKTGYVRQSGHCLVASGTKRGWQLIAVLLDSPDPNGEALRLLEYGFSHYRKQVFARPGDALGRAPVRSGKKRSVPAICQRTLSAITGPGLPPEPKLGVTLEGPLSAPLSEGDQVGEVRLLAGGEVLARSPLLAGESVPRSPFIAATVWTLRALVLLIIAVLLVRTYAKAVKAHRRRGRDLPT